MVNSIKTWNCFDNKRVAVVLDSQDKCNVVIGCASYTYDPLLGNVIRIAVDEGTTADELLIPEDKWNGEIVADSRYDCDFCFRPSPA